MHVYLLFTIVSGFSFEVGTVSAPIARRRPRGASRVVRYPGSFRQRVLVETVVKSPAQGHQRQRRGIFDAAAALHGRIGRYLEAKPLRRRLQVVLRKRRHQDGETTGHGQYSSCRFVDHRLARSQGSFHVNFYPVVRQET